MLAPSTDTTPTTLSVTKTATGIQSRSFLGANKKRRRRKFEVSFDPFLSFLRPLISPSDFSQPFSRRWRFYYAKRDHLRSHFE